MFQSGNFDCPNGADEEFCVSLVNERDVMTNTLNSPTQSSTIKTYQNEGILVIRRNGQWAPLCLENSDVVSSLFGSQSSAAASYNSLNSRSSIGDYYSNSGVLSPSIQANRQASSNLHEINSESIKINKLFKGLSADTIQSENGDLIVANSNKVTLSTYSLPATTATTSSTTSTTNQNTNQPKIYSSRPWFDETSYNWQLDELGRAVCSIQSFNELDSINVTNLSNMQTRSQSFVDGGSSLTGDQLNYFSMNQQNIIFRNSNSASKWSNLFKTDTCLSGKIASIRCKEFGK